MQLEKRVAELEKRVAALEGQAQEQPERDLFNTDEFNCPLE